MTPKQARMLPSPLELIDVNGREVLTDAGDPVYQFL